MYQVLILCLLFGCSMVAATSCPTTASSLDEESRNKILETVNRDRELIRRGELILTNGQRALQGANMKNLTWDCNVEAKVVEELEAMCNNSYGPLSIFEIPYTVSLYGNAGMSISDNVNNWITRNDFNAPTFLQLATNTVYQPQSPNQFTANYLSDVGQTIACASYHCLSRNWTQLICKTSPTVDINETIYVPVETATPPIQGPICLVPDTLLTAANRAKLLNGINTKRNQAMNGTLRLYDGKYALQAQPMPMLSWDCDMEARMQAVVKDQCISLGVPSTTNISSWYDNERYNILDYYVHEFAKTNMGEVSAKFLSNTTYGTFLNFILLDQRALHDKATKIGCAIDQCDRMLGGKVLPMTVLICTFDVNWMPVVNGSKVKIYNTIYDAPPVTSTTTTTQLPTTTTTTKASGCTTNYEVTTTSEPAPTKCLEGYVYFEATNSCYGRDPQIGLAWNTWPKAEQYCERQGGHLASIHNEEENKLIVSLGKPYGWGVWVGLYSVDENYTWKWSDATPIDYVPWIYGADQPINPEVNVSCALASPYYDPRGSLINDLCSNQNYYVCQLPALN